LVTCNRAWKPVAGKPLTTKSLRALTASLVLVAPRAAQASLLTNGSNFVELASNANSAAWQNVTTASVRATG
jgi:hypothetical protein